MATFRFLADMNISPKTVEALKRLGWTISRVSQHLPVNASDPETVTNRLLKVVPQIEDMLQGGCIVTVEDGTFRLRKLPL